MGRTLLCTVGTSIARACPSLGNYQRRACSWDEPADDLVREIAAELSKLELTRRDVQIRASAELNALHRLTVSADDEVILFATDTADGRCASGALKDVLMGPAFGLHPDRVHVHRVEGLQVQDERRLRTVGLVNLVRQLARYLRDEQRRWSGGCVLCPNGGYKGIVPFITILGMLFRVPVVYVFEWAEALIKLPPLPIGVAEDILDRALPALQWARSEGVFHYPGEFHRMILGGVEEEEREIFDAFLEVDASNPAEVVASLSPLADVMLEPDLPEASVVLMLSPEARERRERSTSTERQEIDNALRKLTNHVWRGFQREFKHNSSLEFYGRYRYPWRFAGFTLNGLFHLCWFARHDEYMDRLDAPDRKKVDFLLKDFVELRMAPLSFESPNPASPDASLSWHDLLQQRNRAQSALHEAAAERDKERHDAAELVKRLRAQLQNLERKLVEATTPVWSPPATDDIVGQSTESHPEDPASPSIDTGEP